MPELEDALAFLLFCVLQWNGLAHWGVNWIDHDIWS